MTSDGGDEVRDIRAVGRALLAAVNAGDVTGILACWAPDGVMLPPHHAAVHGHAAIEAYFHELFASRRLTFEFTESVVTHDASLAVERLAYEATATPRAGGAPSEDAGKGVHVYTRRLDGRWQLSQDIWNSDRPARAGA